MPESNEFAQAIAWNDLPTEPMIGWDPATVAACCRVYHRFVEPAGGGLIPDQVFCDLPRWKFFAFLALRCEIVFAGSPVPNLRALPLRRVAWNVKGGTIPGRFAFTEYLTPMFQALLSFPDGGESHFSRETTVVVGKSKDSGSSPLRFYFGLDYRALIRSIWRRGTIYLYNAKDLPLCQQTLRFAPVESRPILPLAKVSVSPADWPVLGQVRGLNLAAQARRKKRGLEGYPWLNNAELHPHQAARARIEPLRCYLDQHFSETIPLAMLGEQLGVSPASALRMFRAACGLSPHHYQIEKRIAHARQELKRGRPIAQVAAEVGFADQTHLNRHFRRVLGITPGEYQRLQ